MSTNRIKNYVPANDAAGQAILPAGFAVCQLPQFAHNPLAVQLIAQQQAFEQAILAAKEEALRVVMGRLQISVN